MQMMRRRRSSPRCSPSVIASGLGRGLLLFWREASPAWPVRPSLSSCSARRPRIPCRRRANPPMTTTASKGACASRPSPVLREEAASWIGLVRERPGRGGRPSCPGSDGLHGAVRRLADSLRHTRGGAGGDGVLARDQPCEVAGYRPGRARRDVRKVEVRYGGTDLLLELLRIRFSSRHIPATDSLARQLLLARRR